MLVVGGGPAGRALAGACAARGLRVELLDPAPQRPWRATYGAFVDDLPADVAARCVAARAAAVAITGPDGERRGLGRDYAVLDVPALRAHLDAALATVVVRTGRVVGWAGPTAVRLADGELRRARVIVDAGGAARPLHRGPGRWTRDGAADRRGAAGVVTAHPPGEGRTRARRVSAEQTAYGVVLDAQAAASLVGPGEAVFMDWRPPGAEPCGGGSDSVGSPTAAAPTVASPSRASPANRSPAGPVTTRPVTTRPSFTGPSAAGSDTGVTAGEATFLYAVPLGRGRVLVEETCLARRPGLALPVLRDRLLTRLSRHGIAVPDGAPVERVRFPVDTPRARGVLAFGAAAPLVHPATGFSVADALRSAPQVATALAAHLPGDPAAARRAARRVLWPPAAVAVHRLRRLGLEVLLHLPAAEVPRFFAAFLDLPARSRTAYLSERTDLRGTVTAMSTLFRRADRRLRAHLLTPLRRGPAPPRRPARTP